ncbi:MAG TPA: NUDIX hydrolase [Rugosibacter sp.]|nr:NUDIX hydrolase [Rugosibacter sp.]HQN45797.1 NUDIX hydrolase [Rugosibacter sp.]HQQ34419.1 NUDIX hydrolase [Rugosibacter sp.]
MNTPWKPNVTVAAIIERGGLFLMVEEETPDGLQFNQPAGHLDEGESLITACARETLEETAWHFAPTQLIGIYQWPRPQGDITYLRFAFSGTLGTHDQNRTLDTGIVRAVWMTPEEIKTTQNRHRSPLIWQCVTDYLAGQRFPLSIIRQYDK